VSRKIQQRNNSFFHVSQKEETTAAGPVPLPIFYYHASALQCYYWVPMDQVVPLLEETPWTPAVFRGDQALAGLAWYQYRETDIGSYNEVGLAVGVYPQISKKPFNPWSDFLAPSMFRKLGFTVLHLPVTTEIAHTAGKELWGYPKFITDIEFSLDQELFAGEVKDPNGKETILRMTGDVFGGFPFPGQNLILYSKNEDQKLRTIINVKTVFKNLRGTSFHLLPGYSNHPMTAAIKVLGLYERHPFLVQFSRNFQSRLNAGQPV